MQEYVYLVTDIEADGPIPGPHSMISLASIACDEYGEEISVFSENLLPLKGAIGHPETMKFWATKPDIWRDCTTNQRDPAEVIDAYARWVESLGPRHIFVAQPASFDFIWVNWYQWHFLNRQAISAYTLDLGSYVHGVFGWSFEKCRRQEWPEEWMQSTPHTHRALDDVQGYVKAFRAMRAEKRRSSSS